MKVWDKVSNLNEEKAIMLIRAYFQEFNPESSIILRGNEAEIEIVCEKVPVENIKAISQCKEAKSENGKILNETSGNKTTPPKPVRKGKHPNKGANKKSATLVVDLPEGKIPELDEIAKKSNSYEEFVKLVAEWICSGRKQDLFENVIKVAGDVEHIAWKSIESELKNRGIIYKASDKTVHTNQVAKKFEKSENAITILKLIKTIVSYSKSDFHYEVNPEENVKQRIKMECMPEIPCFEEKLATIDKTQPIEERIKYVLEAMELREKNQEEQEKILHFANFVIRQKMVNLADIFKTTQMSDSEADDITMILSEFINKFVKKYDSSKNIKVEKFFKDLQKVIILENEIE